MIGSAILKHCFQVFVFILFQFIKNDKNAQYVLHVFITSIPQIAEHSEMSIRTGRINQTSSMNVGERFKGMHRRTWLSMAICNSLMEMTKLQNMRICPRVTVALYGGPKSRHFEHSALCPNFILALLNFWHFIILLLAFRANKFLFNFKSISILF